MSKQAKKGCVPVLRFPEFREAGEWEEKTLEDVAPLQRGFDLPSDQIKLGTIPVVYSNGVQNFNNKGMAKAPGVVTGRSGTIGKIHFIEDGDYWPHNTSLWVTSFKGNHPKFIYFLYISIGISQFASGSGVPTLNRNYVHAFKTRIPPILKEQQKIATCLSSLDELITAQSQKLDALKTHKKGLMQQLFPAEGETVPQLRFPEFREAGEWKIKQFDKLFTIGNGRDYKHLSSGDIPVYGSGGYMLSVDNYLYDGESVCIGRKGTINNPMFLTGKFWTVDTLFYTHSFKDCLPKFIYLIFQNINWLKHNEAGGVPSLSKTNIGKIEVAIPETDEQQKIADCLSSLDELITAQAQKIEALKTHKKGLMQQLFPVVNEVEA